MIKYKIGIGVTTHNRPEVCRNTIRMIKTYMPSGGRLVVVDDGSKTPFKGATHRFKSSNGVAASKNKCLELLDDCDFIFLFDDDVFPKTPGWHKKYISAYLKTNCHHFSLTWIKKNNGIQVKSLVGETEFLNFYSSPAGVMLFLTKKCLQVAGGFDINFNKYGHEHVEYSNRIYNLGLTPSPFCDIKDGLKLIYPLDYFNKVKGCVKNKKDYFRMNRSYLVSQLNSKERKPYKNEHNNNYPF